MYWKKKLCLFFHVYLFFKFAFDHDTDLVSYIINLYDKLGTINRDDNLLNIGRFIWSLHEQLSRLSCIHYIKEHYYL